MIVQLGPRTPVCPALPEPRESYQNQPSKANRIARGAWSLARRQLMIDARKAFPVNAIPVTREAKTGLRNRIAGAERNAAPAAPEAGRRQGQAFSQPVALHAFYRVAGTGRTVAALNDSGQQGVAQALVATHQDDISPGRQLSIRWPKAVSKRTPRRQSQKREVRRGMLQEFPQWGHFALTCRRLF